jgi:hypothetical protein
MKISRILLVSLALTAGVVLIWNQWRLNRAVHQVRAEWPPAIAAHQKQIDDAATKLAQAESRYDDARMQLDIAEQKLATANAQLAQMENRLRQLESSRARRPQSISGDTPAVAEAEPYANSVKRAWGPEQVAGEPDTFQAGDISTAWASREQNAGEEWLKLDYENPVEISEVRVRETYNPGAISKITALLPNGGEVTLWEGVEPQAVAPVEMSFQVASGVNARSVKVYLDTSRVPGWNEIDAVELIGRDGSRQWARQASASSTYAERGAPGPLRELEGFREGFNRAR